MKVMKENFRTALISVVLAFNITGGFVNGYFYRGNGWSYAVGCAVLWYLLHRLHIWTWVLVVLTIACIALWICITLYHHQN